MAAIHWIACGVVLEPGDESLLIGGNEIDRGVRELLRKAESNASRNHGLAKRELFKRLRTGAIPVKAVEISASSSEPRIIDPVSLSQRIDYLETDDILISSSQKKAITFHLAHVGTEELAAAFSCIAKERLDSIAPQQGVPLPNVQDTGLTPKPDTALRAMLIVFDVCPSTAGLVVQNKVQDEVRENLSRYSTGLPAKDAIRNARDWWADNMDQAKQLQAVLRAELVGSGRLESELSGDHS